jgi:Ca2+-binding RTX toxin-like protein
MPKTTATSTAKTTATYGTRDNDDLTHDGMRDLYAGAGDDTITLSTNNYGAKIYAEVGNDIISPHYSGSSTNDWVDGGKGNDKISTGSGNDTVQGGDGNDDITGGAGDDLLLGGPNSDVFHFNYERQYSYDYTTYEYSSKMVGKDGSDVIKDFNVTQDHLKIEDVYSYYGSSSAPDVQVKDTAAGTWVGFEDGSGVLLQNVHGYNSATGASAWLHIA